MWDKFQRPQERQEGVNGVVQFQLCTLLGTAAMALKAAAIHNSSPIMFFIATSL
jgi:hypothetical protein